MVTFQVENVNGRMLVLTSTADIMTSGTVML